MSINQTPEHPPVLVICCGVSGSGKTTLAEHLAEHFGFCFVEADDFHPPVNKAHMASGKPLTDAMREPWVDALCEHFVNQFAEGKSCVMANSGLRRKHRDRFRSLGQSTLFFYLTGPKEMIRKRMEVRAGHYMKPELLDSQYEALELPENEPDVIAIDVSQTIPNIAAQAHAYVRNFLKNLPQ